MPRPEPRPGACGFSCDLPPSRTNEPPIDAVRCRALSAEARDALKGCGSLYLVTPVRGPCQGSGATTCAPRHVRAFRPPATPALPGCPLADSLRACTLHAFTVPAT